MTLSESSLETSRPGVETTERGLSSYPWQQVEVLAVAMVVVPAGVRDVDAATVSYNMRICTRTSCACAPLGRTNTTTGGATTSTHTGHAQL